MARRNAHDFRCAQEVVWLNRDGDEPQAAPAPSRQPHAVMRRRGGESVRVTPVPPQAVVSSASRIREQLLGR